MPANGATGQYGGNNQRLGPVGLMRHPSASNGAMATSGRTCHRATRIFELNNGVAQV